MDNFDNLIAHENEYTYLDFKAIQYSSDKHADLLKDVIAMANAPGNKDRHIILGVNYKNNNDRDIVGIDDDDFIDSTIYQQLIYANIEPKINFEYFAYNFKSNTVGIIKITDCHDKPYMMKKKYGNLKKGDTFIRVGDSQKRLTRSELDKIIESKKKFHDFSDKVSFSFKKNETVKLTELSYTNLANTKLPSDVTREKIKSIIEKKKKDNIEEGKQGLSEIQEIQSVIKNNPSFLNPFGTRSLEEYTIEELEEKLLTLKDDYYEKDIYEVFQNHANKLNFVISNTAGVYIEDPTVEVTFPNKKDLFVLNNVKKPDNKIINPTFSIGYPDIEILENKIIVTDKLDDIKHHIPTEAFIDPLRIIFKSGLNGKTIDMDIQLFAKNLEKPLEDKLQLKIVAPQKV